MADVNSEQTPSEATDPTLDTTATAESAVVHRVEVRVDAARVRKAFDRAYRDLARRAQVKGFRPGKVPRSVLERLYGASVAEQIESTLVSETLSDAIERSGLEPVMAPAVESEPPRPDAEFVYVARVEVKPRIVLDDLQGLTGRRPRVEVSDEEVARELEGLRERHAPVIEEPEGTPAAAGHLLNVSFEGRIDGHPFEGSSGKDVEVEIGSERFVAGFEEQLVGARAGEDREVRVAFPPDYGNAELAGKEAVFRVHVSEVKRRQLPELDDEFAKDLGDFETLDAVRERIRSDLSELRERAAQGALHRSLLDALIERVPFEVPAGLVEQQLERRLRSAVQRLHGSVPDDALRAQLDRWREQWRPEAERDVRESLLLETVARERGLAVDDAAVEARIERLATEQGVSEERFLKAVGAEAARGLARRQLVAERALDFLASVAKVEETTDS